VSDIQDEIVVKDYAITGTSKWLSTGALPEYWGAGNFLALDFIDAAGASEIKVGMVPSHSGMDLVALDEDMDVAFQINDKDAQVFRVQMTVDGVTSTQDYDLSGLTLASA